MGELRPSQAIVVTAPYLVPVHKQLPDARHNRLSRRASCPRSCRVIDQRTNQQKKIKTRGHAHSKAPSLSIHMQREPDST